MKKISLFIATAILLFVGCTKYTPATTVVGEEGEVAVSVTASLPGFDTKAAADTDGHAVTVNHWIFEVLDAQGKRFYREERDEVAGILKQTFKIVLVKNQEYDLLFWAENDGGYYNTDSLTNVKINLGGTPEGYAANLDSRDAFSASKHYKSVKSESIKAELTRPFAQINVITNDLDTLWKQTAKSISGHEEEYAKYEPKNFVMKAIVPRSFNVCTQTCGTATDSLTIVSEKCYTGYQKDSVTLQPKNNFFLHREKSTLLMDYLFASANENDILDISIVFTSNGSEIYHKFTSIPVRRNYRTNVNGKFMSDETEVNVEIKPAWYTPDFDVNF